MLTLGIRTRGKETYAFDNDATCIRRGAANGLTSAASCYRARLGLLSRLARYIRFRPSMRPVRVTTVEGGTQWFTVASCELREETAWQEHDVNNTLRPRSSFRESFEKS